MCEPQVERMTPLPSGMDEDVSLSAAVPPLLRPQLWSGLCCTPATAGGRCVRCVLSWRKALSSL